MKRTLQSRLLALRADKVPRGWLNGEQLARREGYSTRDSFAPVIRQAVKAGLLEQREFRVLWGHCLRLRPHYRYVK